MYSKIAQSFILSLALIIFSTHITNAHSGRTDSSGGHNCYTGSCAGTYHYHNSGSAYTPPAPTYTYTQPACYKPQVADIQARINTTQANCKQNVTISWDKGTGDEKYSIAISKIPEKDPGPIADTTSRTMTFHDVDSGKWYINMKAGNSCGWTNTFYWETDVPSVDINIDKFFAKEAIEENTYHLYFQADCAESISISPEVGMLTSAQISKGYVTVSPTKDTTYKLTVKGHGQTKTREVSVSYTEPSPEPSPISDIEKESKEDSTDTEEFANEDNKEGIKVEQTKQSYSSDANSEWGDDLATHLFVLRVLQFLVFKF